MPDGAVLAPEGTLELAELDEADERRVRLAGLGRSPVATARVSSVGLG